MSSRADTAAQLERMRAFVAAALGGPPVRDEPPAELVRIAHLGPIAYRMGFSAHRAEYAASAIVAERRSAVLREAIAALAAGGVHAALIKGVAYTGSIYPDAAERPMLDIDLLVPAAQLADAIRCLHAIGFAAIGSARRASGYYHSFALSRAGMIVELHRSIVQHSRTALRVGGLLRRARPDASIAGALRLEPSDELLVCALHVARHELAVPAINYVDVSRLWQRLDEEGRDRVQRRAREYRVSRALAAVLSMTELLARGISGRPSVGPIAAVLPGADDVLRGDRPRWLRQVAQKLALTDGPREVLGFGFAYGSTLLDGWRRSAR